MGTVHKLRTSRPGITPAAAVSAYLPTLTAPATIRAYRHVLEAFAARFAGVPDVAEIRPDAVAEWFTGQWGDRSANRWNACLAALKSAYAYWADQDWVHEDGTRRLRRKKLSPDADRALTRGQVEDLLTRKDVGLREKTLWTLLYESAARSAEVLRLDVEGLDMPNRCAEVVRKGGASDWITWQTRTARLLPRYLRGRTTGPVFLTDRRVRSDVGRAAADVDPGSGRGRLTYATAEALFKAASGGCTLHQWRHTGLSHMAEDGTSTVMLKAISGHSSLRSLEKYARISRAALLKYRADTDPAKKR